MSVAIGLLIFMMFVFQTWWVTYLLLTIEKDVYYSEGKLDKVLSRLR